MVSLEASLRNRWKLRCEIAGSFAAKSLEASLRNSRRRTGSAWPSGNGRLSSLITFPPISKTMNRVSAPQIYAMTIFSSCSFGPERQPQDLVTVVPWNGGYTRGI
jgi:hypothetical protein